MFRRLNLILIFRCFKKTDETVSSVTIAMNELKEEKKEEVDKPLEEEEEPKEITRIFRPLQSRSICLDQSTPRTHT